MSGFESRVVRRGLHNGRGMNQLKVHQHESIVSLWKRGWSARRIARELGFGRDVVRKYIHLANEATPSPGSEPVVESKPATPSAGNETIVTTIAEAVRANVNLCEGWRVDIQAALDQGLTAKRIHEDLVREHHFVGSYQAVIHWGRAKGFLTVIYQIDAHCRRLLWVGPNRTQATLRRGLRELGPQVVRGLKFVCTDMWKPYLQVIAKEAAQALHVLDHFHIVMHLNQAVDRVRRGETSRLRGLASAQAEHLKNMRWKLLRRGSRVRGHARWQLRVLVASKLATGRACMLKESFQHFWKYKSPVWAEAFLRVWTARAMRSRIEPMKKVARILRALNR